MMKWLRAHSKQIMVIVVLLAMFSFVGGSALVNILSPNREKEPAFKAFNQVVTLGDLNPGRRDVEVLESLGIPWKLDLGRGRMLVEHWHVLAMEADRAGIGVSDAEIDQQLDQMNQREGFERMMEFARTQKKITPPEIRRALRRQLAIIKYAQHLEGAAFPSEPQVKHHVRDTEEKVTVQFVNLPADKFIDESKPVSEQELQAQFEKYRDADAATSESGFGYKLPRRVRLEYVLASEKTIQPHVQVSFDDIKNHWKANKAKYKKTIYVTPPATSAPTSGPAASQPATQPAPVPQQVEKTFAEAKPDVEAELRRKNALYAMEQAMNRIAAALQKPWLEQKVDPETGYKPIPAAVKAPGFVQQIFEKHAKEFAIPLEYHETEWLTDGQIKELSGMRDVVLSGEGAEGLSVSELAFRIPAFFAKKDKSEESATSLQVYQTPDTPLAPGPYQFSMGGRMQSFPRPKDTLLIFRVVDFHDARPPMNLDEVRAKVEKDVRRLRALAEIKSKAEQLAAAAKKEGLTAALGKFEDLKKKFEITQPTAPPSFARLAMKPGFSQKDYLEGKPMMAPSDVAGVGSSEEFVDACFALAEAPDESALPAGAPTSQPVSPKVQPVELKKMHSWCVIESKNLERVDSQKYESSLRERAYASIAAERGMLLRAKWFDPDQIEKRSGFERIKSETPITREGIQEPAPTAPLLDFGQ